MSDDLAEDLDTARADLLFELGACTDYATCLDMARQIRKADAERDIVAVPRRPTLGMVFAAQRTESGNPAFDELAPRMYEFYEAMLGYATDESPFKWLEPMH